MTTVEKCGVTFKLHDIPAFHETSIDYRNYDAIIAVLDASAGVEENLAIVQNLPMRSIIVVNKTDLHTPRAAKLQRVTGRKVFPMSARNGTGLLEPLEAVIATKM